jgi:hypothetical protein
MLFVLLLAPHLTSVPFLVCCTAHRRPNPSPGRKFPDAQDPEQSSWIPLRLPTCKILPRRIRHDYPLYQSSHRLALDGLLVEPGAGAGHLPWLLAPRGLFVKPGVGRGGIFGFPIEVASPFYASRDGACSIKVLLRCLFPEEVMFISGARLLYTMQTQEAIKMEVKRAT